MGKFLTMTSQGAQALLIDVLAARCEPERAVYLGLLGTRWLRRPFLLGALLRSAHSHCTPCSSDQHCEPQDQGRESQDQHCEPRLLDQERRLLDCEPRVLDPESNTQDRPRSLRDNNDSVFCLAAGAGALGGVWAPALWLRGARLTKVGLTVGLIGATASIAGDRSRRGILLGLNAVATAILANDPPLAVGGGTRWGISHGANLMLAATAMRSTATAMRGGTSRRSPEVATAVDCLTRLMMGVGELLINDGVVRSRSGQEKPEETQGFFG